MPENLEYTAFEGVCECRARPARLGGGRGGVRAAATVVHARSRQRQWPALRIRLRLLAAAGESLPPHASAEELDQR